MKQLILITEAYPYKLQETFLETEVPYLAEEFDLTIVTSECNGIFRNIPEGTNVVYVQASNMVCSTLDKMGYFLKLVCSSLGRIEFLSMIKSKSISLETIKNAYREYVKARRFYEHFKSKGLIKQDAIYYTYWNTYKTLALTMNRKRLGNSKIVSRIHGFDLYGPYDQAEYLPYKKYMCEELDALVFISELGKDYFVRKYRISNRDKMLVSYLGVSEGQPKHINVDSYETHYTVVSCSNTIPLKRIPLIIDALCLIDETVNWIHIGKTQAYFDDLVKYAEQKLEKKKNINYEFLGQMTNQEVRRYYQQTHIDCFVSTSAREGCPVSIMEALSCGIPVVATNVGGISEMIDHNNGILLPSNPTPECIAESILRIKTLADAEKSKLHKSAYVRWKKKFNAEKNYKAFTNFLKDLP